MARRGSQDQVRVQALAWHLALNNLRISVSALEAFWEWRKDPADRAAYAALGESWRKPPRTMH